MNRVKNMRRDFLGGSVVKNPPVSAEDTSSIPNPGRSQVRGSEPHTPQLLNPLAHLEPLLRNKRSDHNEKPKHCNKE